MCARFRWRAGCSRLGMDFHTQDLNRRSFFGTAAGGAALAGAAMGAETSEMPHPAETRKGDMLYRSFGKTGETVSVIGVSHPYCQNGR